MAKKKPGALNVAVSEFWVKVVKGMAYVPLSVRKAIASVLASLMWIAIPSRRHVTMTNLKLCFPELSEDEVKARAKATYRNIARAALDHGVSWAGSADDIRKMVKWDGIENVTSEENRPLIIVAPHFVGLDAVGIAFNLHVRGVSLYQTQSNPAWDKAAFEGRKRFSDPLLIPKNGGNNDLKIVLNAMKDGMPFYYLPDMDHGRKNSIFVPFFGVPAATLPMASRLARLGRAKVVMCIAEMTEDGYIGHISKPLENFPTRDFEADTRRITEELENWIRKLPDQYLWTHRRFKTRPEGEPSVY